MCWNARWCSGDERDATAVGAFLPTFHGSWNVIRYIPALTQIRYSDKAHREYPPVHAIHNYGSGIYQKEHGRQNKTEWEQTAKNEEETTTKRARQQRPCVKFAKCCQTAIYEHLCDWRKSHTKCIHTENMGWATPESTKYTTRSTG